MTGPAQKSGAVTSQSAVANRRNMSIKVIDLDTLIQVQTTRDTVGTQARQEEDIVAYEALKGDIRGKGTLEQAIQVSEWCRYSGVAAPSYIETLDTLKEALDAMERDSITQGKKWLLVKNGHTRLTIIRELAQEGVEKLVYNTGSGVAIDFDTTQVVAEILPSITTLARAKTEAEPGEPGFAKAVNEVLQQHLSSQFSLNMGIKWGAMSQSMHLYQEYSTKMEYAALPSDPYGIRVELEDDDEEKFAKAARKAVISQMAVAQGKEPKAVRDLMSLSDPELTQPELIEAYNSGLIKKSAVIDLRRVYKSPVLDDDGNVTNEQEVAVADSVRKKLLEESINGLQPQKLRAKIAKLVEDGADIKEKSRTSSKPKVVKVQGLSEEKATEWIEKLDAAFDGSDDEEKPVLAGAIYALKAATDPTSTRGIVGYVIDEAEEYLEEAFTEAEIEN
jgi:hypothetical protein